MSLKQPGTLVQIFAYDFFLFCRFGVTLWPPYIRPKKYFNYIVIYAYNSWDRYESNYRCVIVREIKIEEKDREKREWFRWDWDEERKLKEIVEHLTLTNLILFIFSSRNIIKCKNKWVFVICKGQLIHPILSILNYTYILIQ